MTLLRYELQDLLGEGGMGAVYRAYDRLTQEHVALKRVTTNPKSLIFNSRDNHSDPHLSLAHEFQTLAGLRHPHIISVLDFGVTDYPYFTMSLLLDAHPITKGLEGLQLQDKLGLLTELLQALDYLHRRNVLHRDLKPSNVLVSAEGQVKLLDFGLATKVSQESLDTLTGTLAYLAPELLHDEPASTAADLFAAGLMAYEIFTGVYPLDTSSMESLVADLVSYVPDPSLLQRRLVNATWPHTISADQLEALSAVIAKLMHTDPLQRYQHAQDVIGDFHRALGMEPPAETMTIRESYLRAAQFIGRETEMTQLETALDPVIGGASSFWLVGGESGVGKTRLIDEVRIIALVKGMQVLRTRGKESGRLPFEMWRDLLPRLLLLESISDQDASILKEIVPTIDQLLGRNIPLANALPGEAQQKRLIATIVKVVQQVEAPLLLIVDDLQWAGESVMPLQRLLQQREDLSGLMLIGAYRDDEYPRLPEALPDASVIHLPRLSRPEIETLSAAMLGKVAQRHELVELLARETEGNTFFMVEAARALAEEAGSLSNIADAPLPQHVLTGGMQQVLRRRLQTVPDNCQPLLQLAAVVGRKIDEKVMGACNIKINLDDWLLACEAAAVLEIVDDTWQFAHDKLRETVLADLHDAAQLHREVAVAIEDVYSDNPDYNAALLEHWHAAGNLDKELHYLEAVAARLINIIAAYDSARAVLSRALPRISDDDPRRVSVLNWIARAYSKQGQLDAAE